MPFSVRKNSKEKLMPLGMIHEKPMFKVTLPLAQGNTLFIKQVVGFGMWPQLKCLLQLRPACPYCIEVVPKYGHLPLLMRSCPCNAMQCCVSLHDAAALAMISTIAHKQL